ncbi:DNA methyltransferase [Terasakiella brassicae]|jgi:type I restriction enzyme M protein|uniref:site-specific DNA-methyltransferase (adenine-specific) n=1 Tax=Terasakiella brassicae TaxID=1634917 RepID=A0A917C9G6_9PROT|nr:class I SAM-dependent DNA methyltransferase [Terasakiella brassicae]GGF76178.1 DNA methyltransferase [Terasakiella brassicae]
MAEKKNNKNTSANVGFEENLWAAADKMRGNMEPGEYKHVALGLIFLKYISEAFEAKYAELVEDEYSDPEDKDEYLAENIFFVPEKSRWKFLQDNAKQPTIGNLIDEAMRGIEDANPPLKGVLQKDYGRPSMNKTMLGELIDEFAKIHTTGEDAQGRDVFGRVYEYFLNGFAGAEGRRGGEFYTPQSVVRLLVEMLEPTKGRVYDPCCGSGGMFVQSDKFLKAHQGRIGDLAVYGQESNNTTYRLARMNMAVRRIDADIRWNNEGSFHNDEFKSMKFDYIMANPPFNSSDWGGDKLSDDVRWAYGIPPAGNANFAWLQHIVHHLKPGGTAGVVLANGSMSSQQSGEGDIRRAMVEDDVVDCMVALPGQLFYSTQIPACLWFLARHKGENGFRGRKGEILFIDAREMGRMVDRTRRELDPADVQKIADTYHAWRGEAEAIERNGAYEDVPGYCKAVTLKEVETHGFVLTPGRYVGAADEEDDGVPFEEKFLALKELLSTQFDKSKELEMQIRKSLGNITND